MQTKENSFINKFISSIKDFEKYPEMAAKPLSKVIKYLLQLILIFTILVTIISVYDISKDIKTGVEYFKNQVPDVNFADNELKVSTEEKIVIQPHNILNLIIINTNDINEEEVNNYIKDIKNYDAGAIFLKDKLIINIDIQTIEYSYKDIANIYNIGNMTKQDMINYFTGTNATMIYISVFIISFIWLFITYLTSIVFDILALSAIGYVTALILKLRIKVIAMIKISMHALTLPIILNLIYIILQVVFNFKIKYFDIMYIAVTYIYIITAILMIKSDLIKRGQELTKILEEEQKIKQELERQKEEQEEKDKEERKKKEEKENKKQEKKEKEKTKKDEGLQGEPQGQA